VLRDRLGGTNLFFMTRREPLLVLVLTVATCGLYYLYWLWATSAELREISGRDDIHPALDLLATVFTCGLWGFYVLYRNTQVVHELHLLGGLAHDDRSQTVLLLIVANLLVGFAGLIAVFIVQDELNRLADGRLPHLSGPLTF
jgi:TRAP-type C4-dicarboxylate transport system permease small subunit